MGYACPVCEAPQADAEHLANHLAFTAMLHGDDHEAWLDDQVPEWAACDPPTLADAVADHVPETDLPGDEDALGSADGTAHAHDHLEDELARHGGYGRDALDDEARAALQEAREMTARMRGEREESETE